LPEAFRNFAKGKPQWADVVALLPSPKARGPVPKADRHRRRGIHNSPSAVPPLETCHTPLKGRTRYGNPTNFLGLRYEPVNEQGVVLLFGMLARELGYIIEVVQKGFPDCEAMRLVGPERWQRVSIEFEFESRNFRDHGHPLTGCDLIVCWRHNWPACPSHLEVLELANLVRGYAKRVECGSPAAAFPDLCPSEVSKAGAPLPHHKLESPLTSKPSSCPTSRTATQNMWSAAAQLPLFPSPDPPSRPKREPCSPTKNANPH
jgi:hypothetical protein